MFKHNPADLTDFHTSPRRRLDTITIITKCRILRTTEPYRNCRAERQPERTALTNARRSRENNMWRIRTPHLLLQSGPIQRSRHLCKNTRVMRIGVSGVHCLE